MAAVLTIDGRQMLQHRQCCILHLHVRMVSFGFDSLCIAYAVCIAYGKQHLVSM